MNFHIVTIFPEVFGKYFQVGIMGRAVEAGKIKIDLYNLRDYSKNKHHKVDDTPYGGGPGMVMTAQPIVDCIKDIKNKILKKDPKASSDKMRVVLLSAKGKKFDQKKAIEYKNFEHLILICGRYEGVDERIAEYVADEEISVGEYVLSGGEIPAMTVVDVTSRLLPEVLGNENSLDSESYNEQGFQADFPVYTKPDKFGGWEVPEVLLSGNHKDIEEWREKRRKSK
ncbi:MAG: tRNA (guanosine(37)-N1)-methyltransferase TrmD [Candidatus Moranbacteria bacterium]|nr:tRNA (guanosine(37)-N1)-methyltransferase TrmD [Candidatus Moranbacteria bacterium]